MARRGYAVEFHGAFKTKAKAKAKERTVRGSYVWLAADGINKTPGVRVLDVVILGPFMILAALDPAPTRAQRLALAFAGGATATYNLKNYLGDVRRGTVQ